MSAEQIQSKHEWLPDERLCPSWCERGHAQSLYESEDYASSQQHLAAAGGDTLCALVYADRPVREYGGGWDMVITQRPLGPSGGYWGPALVELSVNRPGRPERGVTLDLTSGDARKLAAQLIAAADRLDLA